jgi:KDO2-lipid IV(A) lauroyltransferase
VSELKYYYTLIYHAFRVGMALGSWVPLGITRPLGKYIGLAALGALPRDRRRARAHIRIAFPEYTKEEVRQLLRGYARHFGALLAEVAWLWGASPGGVEKICTIEGLEHLEKALDAGRGAVLTTAHCGNWELLGARLSVAGIPMTAAVRDVFDPRLDRIASRLRSRFGAVTYPRSPEVGVQLMKALTANRVNGLLIDQDIKDVPSVFVPFFGKPAWTPSGAAAISIRKKCPTIPGLIHREPDGNHVLTIHPPLDHPTDGSLRDRVTELTAAATAVIEAHIRAWPEQWVWMHRRWRRQPSSPDGD